jgi:hypothetical protein
LEDQVQQNKKTVVAREKGAVRTDFLLAAFSEDVGGYYVNTAQT